MLQFSSATSVVVDTAAAVEQCLQDAAHAAGRDPGDCRFILVHLTMGHDERAVLAPARRLCPSARIAGCTVAGVIGRAGADEGMYALAVMMAWGDPGDIAMTTTERLDGDTSASEAAGLARRLVDVYGTPRFLLFLGSGIDIDVRACIDGIESVVGPDVSIFGGTSADNMRGAVSYQLIDDDVFEHGALLVGFFDPSLAVHTQASHGFVPLGVEATVTRSEGNHVQELGGRPAWEAYTRMLGLPASATPADTIPPGALGEALEPALAAEYGDSHLLRVVTHRTDSGGFLMPVGCPVGTRLALMRRDEPRIFRNLDVMMGQVVDAVGGRTVVAVFHADCGARGRLTLDRVSKDEIVQRMQTPLAEAGAVPPWIGMYGFGEIARLGGRNRFHNYTTALYVITRRAPTTA
jgi:hypothetical protein